MFEWVKIEEIRILKKLTNALIASFDQIPIKKVPRTTC